MNATTLVGCTFDGAEYHAEHCPEPRTCETEHGAIFASSESQCSDPACDRCGEAIEGTVIIHGTRTDYCEYCAATLAS